MFQADNETDEEGGHLRSGKIFWSNKRKSIAIRRESCSAIERGDYESVPQLNEESWKSID